uniref:Uncharacterized protein n=1 Tax=Arion vulgaris TaxID=1028688 RepID=A0A0B7AEB2_9EUPU
MIKTIHVYKASVCVCVYTYMRGVREESPLTFGHIVNRRCTCKGNDQKCTDTMCTNRYV